MKSYQYDITSPSSIRDYSQALIGKSLEEAVGKYNLDHAANKGKLGSLVEEHFFEYVPGANRDHEPDFSQAGVELKVTGVVRKTPTESSKATFRAKERLVLTMINYYGLAEETWEQSSFLKKCSLMLLLFYLYDKDLPATERKFVMSPVLWTFPQFDLEIIQKDWNVIQQKVLAGLAHELSEGDTFYLSACRKGPGGKNERLKPQPYSATLAKSRAFSLKPSYVNTIIDSTFEESVLIKSDDDANAGIETIVLNKFKSLEGKTTQEIANLYDYTPNDANAKNYLSTLSLRILGTKKKWLPEFLKADIVLKTIRLKANGMPKEAISFPTFNFLAMTEESWEDSKFYEKINQKICFVIYQYDERNELRFKKVQFWNMPFIDRLEAKRVWEETVRAIDDSDMSKLPKSSQSRVAHVRPHAKNKADTLPLPNGELFTKQCFWLNTSYVSSQIN